MKRTCLTLLMTLSILALMSIQFSFADISSSTMLNEPIDDSGILSRVQTAIDSNSVLAGESITVSCNHGIITLEGEVTLKSQIGIAVKTASGVSGVQGVKSGLMLKSTSPDLSKD